MKAGKGEARQAGDRDQPLLELAARLGNISAACRQLGVDRSTYYRAVKNRDRIGARNSRSTPPEVVKRLLRQCLEFPDWGCDRLAYYLTLTGDPISSPTAQKILMRHGLGRAAARRVATATLHPTPNPPGPGLR